MIDPFFVDDMPKTPMMQRWFRWKRTAYVDWEHFIKGLALANCFIREMER